MCLYVRVDLTTCMCTYRDHIVSEWACILFMLFFFPPQMSSDGDVKEQSAEEGLVAAFLYLKNQCCALSQNN